MFGRLMALTANVNRDPKRRPHPWTAEDFIPHDPAKAEADAQATAAALPAKADAIFGILAAQHERAERRRKAREAAADARSDPDAPEVEAGATGRPRRLGRVSAAQRQRERREREEQAAFDEFVRKFEGGIIEADGTPISAIERVRRRKAAEAAEEARRLDESG